MGLAADAVTAIVGLPKGNTLLIMISARVANAVEFTTDFKGKTGEDFFSIICDGVDEQMEKRLN